jgi:acetoin utilization deacetylase AcuC-like enzyme
VKPVVVWQDDYPSADEVDEPYVEEYRVFSRYEEAARLLKRADRFDHVEWLDPSPASIDDLERCCSNRRLRDLLGTPPTVPPDDPGLRAELLGVGGTVAATESVLRGNRSVHIGGGFHHADRGGSSAPTSFNDVICAVSRLLEFFETVAVIDLDVHHPDGTRAEYRLQEDVFLFSFHGWNTFPGTGWIHESGRGHAEGNHLNMPLPAGTTDPTYLCVLDRLLNPWIRAVDPDAIVYVAGGDVHRTDPIGNLALTTVGTHARDQMVRRAVGERPTVTLLGGGYGPAAHEIHANTVSTMIGKEPPAKARKGRERAESGQVATTDTATHSTALRWLGSLIEHYGRHHPGVI